MLYPSVSFFLSSLIEEGVSILSPPPLFFSPYTKGGAHHPPSLSLKQFIRLLFYWSFMLSSSILLLLLPIVQSTTEWWGDLRAHMNPPRAPAFYDVTYDDSGEYFRSHFTITSFNRTCFFFILFLFPSSWFYFRLASQFLFFHLLYWQCSHHFCHLETSTFVLPLGRTEQERGKSASTFLASIQPFASPLFHLNSSIKVVVILLDPVVLFSFFYAYSAVIPSHYGHQQLYTFHSFLFSRNSLSQS